MIQGVVSDPMQTGLHEKVLWRREESSGGEAYRASALACSELGGLL